MKDIAASTERAAALCHAVVDAVAESDCEWAEQISAVGFALAWLIEAQANPRLREGMAAHLADRLMLAARVRGSFGVEKLQ